eukprot:jgi/Mesen1/6023/ME000306S05277
MAYQERALTPEVPLTPEFEEPVEAWEGYTFLKQVEGLIRAGPRYKLDKFLKAVELLLEGQKRFQLFGYYDVVQESASLLQEAMNLLLEEFTDILQRLSNDRAHRLTAERLHRNDSVSSSNAGSPRTSPRGSPGPSPRGSFSGGSFSGGSFSGGGFRSPSAALTSPRSPRAMEMLPSGELQILRKMVKHLDIGGAALQCADAYRIVRAATLGPAMEGLQVKEIAPAALEDMPWSALGPAMKAWVQHMFIVVRVVLAGEQQLFEVILQDLQQLADKERCFADIVRSCTANQVVMLLLRNVKTIALGKRQPEQLFSLLDMYNAIDELWPEVQHVFCAPEFALLRKEFHDMRQPLALAVMATFDEFQSILEDVPPSPTNASAQPRSIARRDARDVLMAVVELQEDRTVQYHADHFRNLAFAKEWVIVDTELRERLRAKWVTVLRDSYREFVESNWKEVSKHYVVTVESVEKIVSEFFPSQPPVCTLSR